MFHSTTNKNLIHWIEECATLCVPQNIVWCDGSEEEQNVLIQSMTEQGELISLNPDHFPSSYLYRSHPNDVARDESKTFICCEHKSDSGPTNNWMSPQQAEQSIKPLFQNCMKQRTMYIIPYVMGPIDSPFSKVGIQITDSPYIVINMNIMARVGNDALKKLGNSHDYVKGMHGLGTLDPNQRFIAHFTESNTIWSINSGYGGNALLSKKCFALRLASVMGKNEGWLAEHMLILGIRTPENKQHYVVAALPSSCGKTNLAMLQPPYSIKGYEITTVGDDIAWLRFDDQGVLRAINPEAGFFGVAPGTNTTTNPNAMNMIHRNTIFTNVGLTDNRCPWWEGMSEPPETAIDWQGTTWTPNNNTCAAHPNSRYTTPLTECPTLATTWDDPQGVPISAIIFGGRRAKLTPLIYQAYSWNHGVFIGATMASETTAAATTPVGTIRRDPMAMRPFCGYHIGDYFNHWLDFGKNNQSPPVFAVNWFRTNDNGQFLWPGFGENFRVLQWIIERCEGIAEAQETPIGMIPYASDIFAEDLNVPHSIQQELLSVTPTHWLNECEDIDIFFQTVGSSLPSALIQEHQSLKGRLKNALL